jgi:uncharacterized protein YoxC
MADNKDLNAKVDELEAAAKKYASKDTVISIGGYEFTPAKLMVAFTLVSSLLGGLYGTFEVYKDYMGMKKKIAEYVSPDLTEIYKKMEVLDANTGKMVEYTRDIKNDLKGDIRRVEGVVENVERTNKQTARETDLAVKDVRDEIRQTRKDVDNSIKNVDANVRGIERNVDANLKNVEKLVDSKIQKALDNPLAK